MELYIEESLQEEVSQNWEMKGEDNFTIRQEAVKEWASHCSLLNPWIVWFKKEQISPRHGATAPWETASWPIASRYRWFFPDPRFICLFIPHRLHVLGTERWTRTRHSRHLPHGVYVPGGGNRQKRSCTEYLLFAQWPLKFLSTFWLFRISWVPPSQSRSLPLLKPRCRHVTYFPPIALTDRSEIPMAGHGVGGDSELCVGPAAC